MTKNKTICFSGHRSFKLNNGAGPGLFSGQCNENWEEIAVDLRSTLLELIESGYSRFLCGMAEGFDLLAGRVLIDLKQSYPHIEIIAAIPYPGQEKKFSEGNKEIYYELLNQAADKKLICENYSYDCFHKRNDYLVDNSSLLVCYYNGSKGGTAYTYRKARKEGLKIVNLFR